MGTQCGLQVGAEQH